VDCLLKSSQSPARVIRWKERDRQGLCLRSLVGEVDFLLSNGGWDWSPNANRNDVVG